MHGWNLFSRKPGALGNIHFLEADRSEKVRGHHADMHVAGESDSSIVPKQTNNDRVSRPAEPVWRKGS